MGCCELRFPDLGSKAEALVVELLTASRGRPRSWQDDDRKRKIDPNLGNMLIMLKNAAIDPCDDRVKEDQEWERQVLSTRKALFVIPEKCADAEDFPFRKRKRHTSDNMSSKTLDQQKRRSKRLIDLEKFGDILSTDPSKRIPIGGHAQADVPDWIGPAGGDDGSEDNLDESRWLGTTVWPTKWNDTELKWDSIGKGRQGFCGCGFSGSVNCVKLHVRSARRHLKSDLGPAFFDWCFQQMGEEVSKSWTRKDQAKFDEIVRLNPESEGKSFWDKALKHFSTKRRKDIVRYYFNVYVLRWIRGYTRLKSEAADSDDNVDDEDSRRAFDYLTNIKDSGAEHSMYSKRRGNFFPGIDEVTKTLHLRVIKPAIRLQVFVPMASQCSMNHFPFEFSRRDQIGRCVLQLLSRSLVATLMANSLSGNYKMDFLDMAISHMNAYSFSVISFTVRHQGSFQNSAKKRF